LRIARGTYQSALRLARATARVLPDLVPGTDATMRANLRLVYGDSEDQLAPRVWTHFAKAFVDCVWFRRLFDPGKFDRHFEWVGDAMEHYRNTEQRGAVLVTGHFGNWELMGAAFHYLGIPLSPIVYANRTGRFARRVDEWRRSFGQELIPKRNALALAMKAIRKGRCVAFMFDQSAGRYGIQIPFLGVPAYTHLAPARLAERLDVPIYAGYSTRLGDGIRYRCHAETVSREGDAETVTRRLNDILGGYVRACPEQWWWFHRRFKELGQQRRQGVVDAAGRVERA
jgi:KDO2-lipid IV(A) lauroyltransferase